MIHLFKEMPRIQAPPMFFDCPFGGAHYLEISSYACAYPLRCWLLRTLLGEVFARSTEGKQADRDGCFFAANQCKESRHLHILFPTKTCAPREIPDRVSSARGSPETECECGI